MEFKKREIGNMENFENVKEDNRNKTGSILGGGGDGKTRKGIQWNKYNYYYKLE